MKQGWEIKQLGQIGKVSMCKRVFKEETTTEGDIPFYKIGTFGKRPDAFITKERYNEFRSKFSFPKKGDILISASGTIGRRVRYDGEPAYFQDSNIVWIDNNEKLVLNDYLYRFYEICNWGASKGATISRLYNDNLKQIEIPYPKSLIEQQRIVAILDEAFAAIAKAKANAEQNLKNAKELFESYLQGVFENKGEGWVNATIGETCNLQTGGTPSTSKKEFYEGGTIKWLVSGDINQKVINDCEGRITELGMNSSNTKYLPINSVLIALNGQGKTRGTVAMLRTKATCNQSLVSIFPKDEKSLLPELVFSNLEGRYDEIRKMTGDSGNDRRGLNMPLIRSIKFSYPKKINEQKEIIKKLDDLRSVTKKLEAIYQQKINDLEELKKSILQKAFSGELKMSESGFAGLKDEQDLSVSKSGKSSNRQSSDSDNLKNKQDLKKCNRMTIDEITYKINGCAMKVHNTLGNGFQEVIYQRCLAIEMQKAGLSFGREIEQVIYYDGIEVGTRRADFVVEN